MKKEMRREKRHVINVGLRKLAERTASTDRGYYSSPYRQKRKTNGDERRSHHICAFSIIGFIICSTLLVTLTGTVGASSTYYASPSGGGNGLSASSPFQIANFWNVAQPGDTLILLDGTYTGDNSMISPGISGSAGSPITIRALNDGQAIIDGQNARRPIYISSKSYIDVEGVRCQNSNWHVVYVYDSDHINLRRVSGYNANSTKNDHIFSLDSSSYCLLEDCAASGTGRHKFVAFESSYVTFRRCWARFTAHSYSGPRDAVVMYGSHHCLAENCIGTVDQKSTDGQIYAGISLVAANYDQDAPSYNEYYGNVIYDWKTSTSTTYGFIVASNYDQITGTKLKNNVFINHDIGINVMNDNNLNIDQNTVVDASDYGYYQSPIGGNDITANIKNTILMNGNYGIYRGGGVLTHSYNDVNGFSTPYTGTSQGTGEVHIDPQFDTTAYGKGAYLIRPPALKGLGENGADMGAEVLYRYENGILTDAPLWPWPMEERIFAETGISPTWEANGGLWKTLDGVYASASTGTISGTITDKETGNPIEGAAVSANAYSGTTNLEGKYTLSNIPVGTYTVTASKSGYLVQSRTNVQVVGGQTTTVNLQLTEEPGSEPEPEPESNLIGKWHFDEGSGTTAIDSSGNSNDGLLVNNPVWVDGKVGKALQFDSTNYVNGGSDPSLDITEENTIMAWVKFKGGKTYVDYIKKSGSYRTYWLYLYWDGTKFSDWIWSATPAGASTFKEVSTGYQLPEDTWTHLAVVFDGSAQKVQFYVNGTLVASKDVAYSATRGETSNLMIGEDVNGRIDEVKIYSRALTAEEIQADYQAGLNETTTGTISGTVTDKETGNPIEGATVSANAYSSTTNSEGKYTLSNIPEGSYTVTASKEGYLVQSQTNVLVASATTVNFQLTEVPEPEPDLVGEWHFDEGSGTTAIDSSGNSNDGILVNNPVWVNGKVGKALQFDSTNYVNGGSDSSLDITGENTIMAWVKFKGGKTYIDYIKKSGSYRTYWLYLYWDGTKFSDWIWSATPAGASTFEEVSTGYQLPEDTWTHLAVVFDGSAQKVQFYVNGALYASKDVAYSATRGEASDLKIGEDVTGLIDEVKIYSRALSAEEIQADYEAGLDDETPPTTVGAVSGTIVQASDESGIAGVTVDLMQEDTVVASTVTDSNGDYLIPEVPPGEYTLNASKVRFWSDSTSATVIADETVTAQCTLWLKGDLNNNGVAADEDDLAMTSDATVGKITPGENYDLNENGRSADAADQAMMIDAAAGKIILE